MKQHITPNQLNELSDKGKKALSKFVKNKSWDVEYSDPTFTVVKLPLLSIGQMIEYLGEVEKFITVDNHYGWVVTQGEDEIVTGMRIDELCDALWEAVKEVLNGK